MDNAVKELQEMTDAVIFDALAGLETRSGRCDVNCPHCNAEIERGEDPDYSQYDCPECGQEVVVDNTNRSED